MKEFRHNARRISDICKDLGLGMKDMSTLTGISYDSIVKYINGKCPTVSDAVKISTRLKLPLEYVVGMTDNRSDASDAYRKTQKESYTEWLRLGKPSLPMEGVTAIPPWPYNLYEDVFGEHVTHALSEDQERAANWVLGQLQGDEHDAVMLRYRNGHTLGRTAKMMGIPKHRLEARLRSALGKTRYLLGVQAAGPAGVQPVSSTPPARVSGDHGHTDDPISGACTQGQGASVQVTQSTSASDSVCCGESCASVHVTQLGLSSRAENALRRAGIETVGEMEAFGEQNLLDIRGLGKESLSEMKTALQRLRK